MTVRDGVIVGHDRCERATRTNDEAAVRCEREMGVFVDEVCRALISTGGRLISEARCRPEFATAELLKSYMSSLVCLADRNVLREFVAATLWPDRTVARQLLVLKMRIIDQIAGHLAGGQAAGTIQPGLSRYKAAFVVFGIFIGALTIYLQDEATTPDSASRIIENCVHQLFCDWSRPDTGR